jgi:SAM-dependent methyltransferase
MTFLETVRPREFKLRNAEGQHATASVLRLIEQLRRERTDVWAWHNFEHTVLRLMAATSTKTVMEIGAGRRPMLTGKQISSLNLSYTANDISERELARAPSFVSKACFDIAGKAGPGLAPLANRYDLIFSKMVFEHIPDTRQAYRNILELLAPGGICINYHPVLYSPPFLINLLLPDAVTAPILRMFNPSRHDGDVPKFPAKYDRCVISAKLRSDLRDLGFREVWQIPFFYHGYFKKIPGLFQLDRSLSKVAEHRDWQGLASFCYTIAMK